MQLKTALAVLVAAGRVASQSGIPWTDDQLFLRPFDFPNLEDLPEDDFDTLAIYTGLPLAVIDADAITPTRDYTAPDSEGLLKCCPPGTVFNGEDCVFLASTICPKGYVLDPITQTICINKTPPCPGDLYLHDGLCISPDPPNCTHPAVLNETSKLCESRFPPKCHGNLKLQDGVCIAPGGPSCDPGFYVNGTRCVSHSKPQCQSTEDFDLLIDTNDKGLGVCVTKKKATCDDPSIQVDKNGWCTVYEPAKCPDDRFTPNGKSCEAPKRCSAGTPTEIDSPAGRIVVCRDEKPIKCKEGTLQCLECMSDKLPCEADMGFKMDPTTGNCIKTVKACADGFKIVIPKGSGNAANDQEPQPACCPAIEGIEIKEGRCVAAPTNEACTKPLSFDKDTNQCVYTLTEVDCSKIGATLNSATSECVTTKPPVCEEDATPLGSKCVRNAKCDPGFYPDGQNCVKRSKPGCPPPSYQDGNRCVDPRTRPECPGKQGELTPVGLDCVSPTTRPKCNPDSGTEFDLATGLCVSKVPPGCGPGFHAPVGTDKCVSDAGPGCPTGFSNTTIPGKCVSDQEPVCEGESRWIEEKKACVAKTGPCKKGDPDEQGNCVLRTQPTCPLEGTKFQVGVGCIAERGPDCSSVPGTKLNETSKQCESAETPNCGQDKSLKVVGNQCVSDIKPNCPPGTAPTEDGTKCVAKTALGCRNVPGLVYDEKIGKCVDKDGPRCPQGAVVDELFQKCIVASSRTCFLVYTCPDVDFDLPLDIEPDVTSEVGQSQESAKDL
ncbi:hypothetical protein QBC43DRAFT_303616 [Cladorrhinum sp. PSN259]|nr:hypothetical protein QBC43DRAFT_303616 [Cladorrhinum sp. PSN259]